MSVHLVEHVEGQQREAQVVDHHGTSAGVRLPVLHVLGPHPHDEEIDDCQRKGCWVVVQQQQASHPLIWTQMENVVTRAFPQAVWAATVCSGPTGAGFK